MTGLEQDTVNALKGIHRELRRIADYQERAIEHAVNGGHADRMTDKLDDVISAIYESNDR